MFATGLDDSASIQRMMRPILAVLSLFISAQSQAIDPVVLQLKWQHAYQFAGYYVAVEKGYYREVGLAVDIREGGPTVDFVNEVVSGRAEYGTGSTGLVLDRNQGKPVVVLGVIFQHAPDVVIVPKAAEIYSPQQLIGKRIAIKPFSVPSIQPMLLRETGNLNHFVFIDSAGDHQGLIEGRFDAFTGYITDQPFFFQQQNFPITLLRPIYYGIDFYGDNLFTSEQEIRLHPHRAKAFLAASLKDWDYAMRHPDETIDIVQRRGSTHSSEHLRFEYQAMRELLMPDFIQIGQMNPGRWRFIADTYVALGELKADYSLEGFLLDEHADAEKLRNYLWIAVGALIALVIALTLATVVSRRIRRSEARFRSLFEKSADAYLLLEGDRIVDCNSAAVDLFRAQDRRALFGLHPGELSPSRQADGQDSIKLLEALLALAWFEGSHRFEWQCRRVDGVLFPAEVLFTRIQADVESRMHVVLRDISQRKRAELAMQTALSRFEAIFENTPNVAIQGYDRDGTIKHWNRACESIYGYRQSEAMGRPLQSLLGISEEETGFLKIVEQIWQDQRATPPAEWCLTARDGRTIWVLSAMFPVLEDDRVIEVFCMDVDITAIKQAEQTLRAAKQAADASNRAKSQFLAMMSHEIRTPLNGVLGFAQLLMQPDLSEANRLDYAATISRSGEYLLKILNDILDFTKIEVGRLDVDQIYFNPVEVIECSVSLLQESARQKSLDLTMHIDPSARGLMHGDPLRLQQILTNLIGNSIKFTKTGGVTVKVLRTTDLEHLYFEVRDTGIGMDQEALGRLFQPFVQGDQSVTRKFGGTGLGLAISQQLCRLMGGEIHVKSAPNHGSVFYFEIPAQIAPLESITPIVNHSATSPIPSRQRAQCKILIVEDNAINRKLVEALLRKLGYTYDSVENGQQALDILDAGIYSAVLMDCQMPVMDGFAATQAIRVREAQENRPHLPIIALTAGALEQDRSEARAAGMDDFLAKPINVQRLMDALDRHCLLDSHA